MTHTECKHERTTEGEPMAYMGGVAVAPYTHQEPRASGGITIRVTCLDCKRSRLENHNGRFAEVGPWHLPETTVRVGQWLVIANASGWRNDHLDGDRGDFVAVFDSEYRAKQAARFGLGGYHAGVLRVREAGKVRTPRGCVLE